MSAILGILNKHAVAIAADSAVTIGGVNGRKIFNTANKIFTLSKFHPVGVMLYNSASFMSCPWEAIIKVYRKNLGQKSFRTLKEYQEDFIKFLRDKDFYSDENNKKNNLYLFAQTLLNSIAKEALSGHESLIKNPSDSDKIQVLDLIELKIDNYLEKFSSETDYCEDFLDYTYEEFHELNSATVEEVISMIFHGYEIKENLNKKAKQIVHVYLKIKEVFTSFTGLVFVGYGENEIYPSLIPLNISFAIGQRLRFYIDLNNLTQITNENSSTIRPFAQTDVINTILSGIDPVLEQIYTQNFAAYFKKYNEIILKEIGDKNPELYSQISSINIQELINGYIAQNSEAKKANYIMPLMNAVSTLSKEDLSEMAESLIYLTYLKRRITFAEESVGGPVDVAIISKGDGFVWIKRKHYFNPNLNQPFFQNYLSS